MLMEKNELRKPATLRRDVHIPGVDGGMGVACCDLHTLHITGMLGGMSVAGSVTMS